MKRKYGYILLVIILVALGLRLWGINHGLPYSYYPDEKHFVNRSVAFGNGDLNPHWFHKPALFMYILFFEYGMFYVIGKLIGVFHSLNDFIRLYFTNPAAFYLIGRITTTLFGVATVFFTYLASAKMYGKKIGLIASLFLTFTYAHVVGSQNIKADVPSAFFVILSFLFIYLIYTKGNLKYYIYAGLFAGLGVATKYYPVFMFIPLIFAHFLQEQAKTPLVQRVFNKRLILGIVCIGIGFFIGSPYNFLDSFWFKNNIIPLFKNWGSDIGTSQAGSSSIVSVFWYSFIHYIKVILKRTGMGVVLGGLSLIGIIMAVVKHTKEDILVLSTIVPFSILVIVMFPSYADPRHLMLLYPFFAILAAVFIVEITKPISERLTNIGAKNGLFTGICVLLILSPAYNIIRHDYLMAQKNTRIIAKEWIETHIPEGTKILLDSYGPQLQMSKKNLERFYQAALKEDNKGPFTAHLKDYYKYQIDAIHGRTYDITKIEHPWWEEKEEEASEKTYTSEYDRDMGNPLKKRGVMPLGYYVENDYEYVITNSRAYDMYAAQAKKANFPSFADFYASLEEKCQLVKNFDSNPVNRPGPDVKIYKLQKRSSGKGKHIQ